MIIQSINQTPSGQSQVYRFTQLRTDGVHCRESAGTGPVNLKVVPVTGAAFASITMDQLIRASLSHTHHYWYEMGMLKVISANCSTVTINYIKNINNVINIINIINNN